MRPAVAGRIALYGLCSSRALVVTRPRHRAMHNGGVIDNAATVRKLFHVCLVTAACAGLVGCQSLYFRTLNAGATPPVRSAEYAPGRWLDVYRPETSHVAAPVVLFLYGGRWRSGQREDYAFVGEALAEAGVLTLIADYRSYPEVRFPDFVDDVAHATAWSRAHAAALGGDPARLFVAGHSAGAHIAALVATDPRYLAAVGMQPGQLAGVIGIAGPYDFLPLTDPDLIAVFGAEKDWPQSQPVNFVSGDEPPFLLLHGSDDRLVWLRNSERMAARLDAAGSDVELRRYDGVGHIRILASLRFDRLAPTRKDLLDFVNGSRRAAGASAATADH
jgi:acetyl esterase/lipase